MAAAWTARGQPGELRVATGKAPANNRRGWGFTDDDMTILDAFDLESSASARSWCSPRTRSCSARTTS
jgi:hypothetical protein